HRPEGNRDCKTVRKMCLEVFQVIKSGHDADMFGAPAAGVESTELTQLRFLIAAKLQQVGAAAAVSLCGHTGEGGRCCFNPPEEACGLRDEEEEKRVVGKNQTVEDWLPAEEQRTEELSIKTREILGV
ncbi:hypothetical protein ATANTOWER_025868, partial [Ataeniobius toweri]|nr:hypothetical protein [Ataeniobius toweri]